MKRQFDTHNAKKIRSYKYFCSAVVKKNRVGVFLFSPLRHAKRQPSVEAPPLTTGPKNAQSNRNAASPPAPPAYTVYPSKIRGQAPATTCHEGRVVRA
jgi:hypothetical protein